MTSYIPVFISTTHRAEASCLTSQPLFPTTHRDSLLLNFYKTKITPVEKREPAPILNLLSSL